MASRGGHVGHNSGRGRGGRRLSNGALGSRAQRGVAGAGGQSSNGQCRAWVFTLYALGREQPGPDGMAGSLIQFKDRADQLVADGEVRYIVAGREVCPTTGRTHLQGYVEFPRPRRLGGIKGLFNRSDIHLEPRHGTKQQAIEYAKKDDCIFIEAGDSGTSQGRRTDLDEVKTTLDSTRSLSIVSQMHFGSFLRYHKGIQSYLSLNAQQRSSKSQVIWKFGPTGCGKSMGVLAESRNFCQGSVWWSGDPSLTWFEGYTGEKGAIIDDYGGGAKFDFLLRLLDRYPLRVPVKGSSCNWAPVYIWITSNFHPSHYHGDEPNFDALMRRIDLLEDFYDVDFSPWVVPNIGYQ